MDHHSPNPRPFGVVPDGQMASLYTLTNARGAKMMVTDYGCAIVSLWMPDRSGRLADVVLGFDALEGYLLSPYYLGAVIGRYANRIAGGRFAIGQSQYHLSRNNAYNALHGGIKGFDKVIWEGRSVNRKGAEGVAFSLVSPDGEEGYPGRLTVQVTYRLTDQNELWIDYQAETDRDTIINLTNHTYFNLSGDPTTQVLDHELTIHADQFLPIHTSQIPVGVRQSVTNTPFDFRRPIRVGERIDGQHEQLVRGHGYDHCWVFEGAGGELREVAQLYEPASGRCMTVRTTEPGMQLYTGNYLEEGMAGKDGKTYGRRSGLCLETQHFPDSPNQPSFPSTLLRAGQVFRSQTQYAFSAK